MPDSDIRRNAAAGTRREGRRSLSAYGSHARGNWFALEDGRPFKAGPVTRGKRDRSNDGGFSAGLALALVYPLVRGARDGRQAALSAKGLVPPGTGGEGAECMKRKPSIRSLETVSAEEAQAYLDHAKGDELSAAYALAWDRNRLDGSIAPPDEAEVHHALFLLCRARGKLAPSFDEMRVELRRRAAA
jgi:hypothetical protein